MDELWGVHKRIYTLNGLLVVSRREEWRVAVAQRANSARQTINERIERMGILSCSLTIIETYGLHARPVGFSASCFHSTSVLAINICLASWDIPKGLSRGLE